MDAIDTKEIMRLLQGIQADQKASQARLEAIEAKQEAAQAKQEAAQEAMTVELGRLLSAAAAAAAAPAVAPAAAPAVAPAAAAGAVDGAAPVAGDAGEARGAGACSRFLRKRAYPTDSLISAALRPRIPNRAVAGHFDRADALTTRLGNAVARGLCRSACALFGAAIPAWALCLNEQVGEQRAFFNFSGGGDPGGVIPPRGDALAEGGPAVRRALRYRDASGAGVGPASVAGLKTE